jgi:methyltransferase (TIGR00027 family)
VEAHSALAAEMLRNRLARGHDPEPGGLRDDVYHLLRKRFVEDEARAALSAGAVQAVVFGAGYDTLALRLARAHPGLRFVEVDHPDTQEVKRRALAAHGGCPRALRLVPRDLGKDGLEDALRGAGIEPGRPSLFVAEGLLPYLPPPAVDGLLAAARTLGAAGSRMVLTVVERRLLEEEGSEMARIARVSTLCGEPILSSLDLDGLDGWLAVRGFRRRAVADSAALRERYLAPLGLDRPVGVRETLVVAEAA